MATFWERPAAFVVSHFGLEDRTLVLIASGPGHCLPFTIHTVLLFACYLSLVMRKPAFCICENKDADQLRSNCAADQRLCFRYTDSAIPLLPKCKI